MVDIKNLKKQEEELNIERKKAADERDVQKGKISVGIYNFDNNKIKTFNFSNLKLDSI